MSYVALDLENMKVLFKAPDIRSACLISALDYEDTAHCIFPVERDSAHYHHEAKAKRSVRLPGFLTRMEQAILYRNMTGKDEPKIFGDLMAELHIALCDLPEMVPSLFELEKRAGPDSLPCDQGMPDPNNKPKVIQPVSIPLAPSTAPALAIPMAPRIPMAPAIPKAPGAIPMAPKPGGTTAKVWAIAESILAKATFGPPDMKELRKLLVAECEAEGINPGTAGTQFAAWKRSKNL